MKNFMLLVVAAFTLTACPGTQVKPTVEKLIHCAGQTIESAVMAIMPDIEKALSGGEVDWAKALAKLLPVGEEAVVCAVDAWASGSKAAPLPAVNSLVAHDPAQREKVARAQAWLQANMYKVTK